MAADLVPYTTAQETNVQLTNEANANAHEIHCPACKSLILKRGVATRVEHNTLVNLPSYTSTTAPPFNWAVPTMMHFENIGFSHAVDGRRFLACADCEGGPVGYAGEGTFLIAGDRVRYGVER
ncbi:hypothetical protein SpCBS45565_g00737 [Spizellomyces sp. 'palustris']|nr:hypothetical protein SpCBS45565_g00737 [Spizellomyces sp. 'palustris']